LFHHERIKVIKRSVDSIRFFHVHYLLAWLRKNCHWQMKFILFNRRIASKVYILTILCIPIYIYTL
jgi:hypothetical protein